MLSEGHKGKVMQLKWNLGYPGSDETVILEETEGTEDQKQI